MEKFVSITLLLATIRIATPLILAALGGLFSEKSGIVNIALEGIMLIGAFFAVVGSYLTGNPWIGVIFAIIAGALTVMLHGFVSIYYNANQIVSGTAINILASGITVFLLRLIFNVEGTTPSVKQLPQWGIPNTQYTFNPIVYISLISVAITWFVIYKTPFGLKLRACGEHPHAADSVGIKIKRVRFITVLLSGVLAGLAGAQLSIGEGSVFVRNMTSGRGFIALAALIFGNWNPIKAWGASILFGYAEALQISLTNVSIFGIIIPSQFIAMIPYVVTIVVLAGVVGRSVPPSELGNPFKKGER